MGPFGSFSLLNNLMTYSGWNYEYQANPLQSVSAVCPQVCQPELEKGSLTSSAGINIFLIFHHICCVFLNKTKINTDQVFQKLGCSNNSGISAKKFFKNGFVAIQRRLIRAPVIKCLSHISGFRYHKCSVICHA